MKSIAAFILMAVFWAAGPFYAKAQLFSNYNFRFKTYTTSDGLAHNSVKKCLSDSKGFLWMITENGLSRFDGFQFKNYQHVHNDSSSLAENDLYDIAIDGMDNIYVAYQSGISMLERVSGKFSVIKNNGTDIKASAVVYDSSTRMLFIFTPGGMVKYNTVHKQAKQATVFNPNFPVVCRGMFADHDGYLWALLERGGYYRYSIAKDTAFYYAAFDWPMAMYKDGNTYYVSTWGSGFKSFMGIQNESNKTTYALPLSDVASTNQVFAGITAAPQLTGSDLLWVVTYTSGIGLFSKSLKKFVNHFAYRPQFKNGISSNYFWNIYTAPDGNLWICGWHGLVKVGASSQHFQHSELPELNSSSYNAVTGIADDPVETSTAWVAVDGDGIAKYNKEQNKITARFYYNESNLDSFYMQRWCYGLIKDSNNVLWSGTYGGLIKIARGRTAYITLNDHGNDVYFDKTYADSSGNIWLLGRAAFRYNPYTGKYDTWHTPEDGHARQRFLSITEIRQGLFYAACTGGLYMIDTKSNTITTIDYAAGMHNEAWKKPENVIVIGETLYIGTKAGMAAYGIHSGKLKIVGAASGLKNLNKNAFYLDHNQILWVYCATGLFRYNPATEHLQQFSTTDGLYVTSSDPAFFFEYNSATYIGARMAVTKFKPGSVSSNTAVPVPYITGITINDHLTEIIGTSELPAPLTHHQNSIAFDFTAIEYNFPDKLSFSYMLEGFDTAWSNAANTRKKSYTNLPPGNYTFKLRAFNNNNIEGKYPAVFSFVIAPAFWQTMLFRLLMLAVISAALFTMYRYSIQSYRKKQEEKNKLQQMQVEQYQQQLEIEQIINFFSTSLADKNTQEEVIWDVAKNLIQRLGFANCMIYLWNDDKTVLLQKAGYGPNGSLETVVKAPFNATLWQGIVGHVAATKKPILLPDTRKDPRYRADVLSRLSELCVPALYNGELVSVIDSEDFAENYYTQQHLQILTTIATLMAARLVSIEAAEETRRKKEEVSKLNEQLAQLELASLRSQMNPHFLFNSLNSIHKYIWENKQEDASEYLTKFSKLVRMILENSKEKTVPLQTEIEMLHLYVELEHRRCNGKFSYNITVSPDIDTENTSIPSMLLQPYVENAVWHGLVQKALLGHLLVAIEKKANKLICMIDDDGIGRAQAMEIKNAKQDKHKSLGLSITSKRISLLKHETGEAASVRVIDKLDAAGHACGTTIILELPFSTIY